MVYWEELPGPQLAALLGISVDPSVRASAESGGSCAAGDDGAATLQGDEIGDGAGRDVSEGEGHVVPFLLVRG